MSHRRLYSTVALFSINDVRETNYPVPVPGACCTQICVGGNTGTLVPEMPQIPQNRVKITSGCSNEVSVGAKTLIFDTAPVRVARTCKYCIQSATQMPEEPSGYMGGGLCPSGAAPVLNAPYVARPEIGGVLELLGAISDDLVVQLSLAEPFSLRGIIPDTAFPPTNILSLVVLSACVCKLLVR
jgi:hypothetical protein